MGDRYPDRGSIHAVVGSQPQATRAVDPFSSLIERTANLTLKLADDGTIRSVSHSFACALGCASGDLVGRSAAHLIHPEDRPATATLEMTRRTGVPLVPTPRRWIHADGTYRMLELTGVTSSGGTDFVVHLRDVTQRTRTEEKLRDLNAALEMQVADLLSAARDREREVGERMQAEAGLRASEERLRRQFQAIPVPMYSWRQVGDDFVLEDFNAAGEAITEGVVRTWVGRRASELYAHSPEVLAEFHLCAAEQRTVHRQMPFRFQVTNKDLYLSVSYVFVAPDVVLVHTEDITERTRAEADLRQQALHDGLTGLANRVLLYDQVEAAMRNADQLDASCALLVLDLDRFKEVNDSLGHH
ncbi:MAG: PAS domain S-box protein, partial [Chloroflexi bacterium]|nr:PAS domain S-box protein [Chloroflexota bacterium]